MIMQSGPFSDDRRDHTSRHANNDRIDAGKRDATDVDPLRAAELSLVDALLSSLSKSTGGQRERRIDNVMAAIDVSSRRQRITARTIRSVTVIAVAAGLLLAVSLFWIHTGRKSLADEVLFAVHQATTQPIDRVYTIHRILPASTGSQLPHGTLYLRGQKGFVVTWSDVVLGRWEDQFWLVSERQRVTLADDFFWIDTDSVTDRLGIEILQELSLQSKHVSLVQLASVAGLMQHDYDVSLNAETLNGLPVDLLVGHLRSQSKTLPRTIRLWASVDTHVVYRTELRWEPDNAICLELLPEQSVSMDWYQFADHCDAEPIVHRISSP
jgi:hypothetical protein